MTSKLRDHGTCKTDLIDTALEACADTDSDGRAHSLLVVASDVQRSRELEHLRLDSQGDWKSVTTHRKRGLLHVDAHIHSHPLAGRYLTYAL